MRPLLMLAVAALAVAGCTSSPDASSDPAPVSADGVYEVMVRGGSGGFAFEPNDLTINVGDTVRWINGDGTHTVTSGANSPDGRFDASLNSPGETFEYTFTQAGEFPYYCKPHLSLGMTGKVTVA